METRSGTVFWLTGLSGSGKTTLGKALTNALKCQGHPVIFFDGDQLREITGHLFGHEQEERLQASLVYARLCHTLAAQSFHVVCATISLFHETQRWNRHHIPNYIEIFLDIPLSHLIERDSKKIYMRAQKGQLSNVVGIDIVPEFPQKPDIAINNPHLSIQEAVDQIIALFHEKFLVHDEI